MLDQRAEWQQKARNVVQSTLLVGCLLAVTGGLSVLLFGTVGVAWLLALGTILLLFRPRIPPRMVLAMYGAQRLTEDVAPELCRTVEELARRAGLHHPPALYYVPSPFPNCFSLGHRGRAAIGVTDGLLRSLTRRELAGVLAHEVGHLRAGDATVMILSDAIGRLVQALGYLGLLTMLVALPLAFTGRPRLFLLAGVLVATPFVVTSLQLALSRSREFDADLAAARLTGDPEGLACALEALDWSGGRVWERILGARGRRPEPLILQTHPPTAERTRRLRELVSRDTGRWLDVGSRDQ